MKKKKKTYLQLYSQKWNKTIMSIQLNPNDEYLVKVNEDGNVVVKASPNNNAIQIIKE